MDFTFPQTSVRFVRFEILDFWGSGGGLQYFEVHSGTTPTRPTTIKPDPQDVCTCGLRKPIEANQGQHTTTTTPKPTTLKPNSKIVGGVISEWHPWVAVLLKEEDMVSCTGTLIGKYR